MTLCLDIGNSQIYGGVFEGGELKNRFRRVSDKGASSDELGVFFKSVLRENGYNPANITEVGCCSVVPDINHAVQNSILKYFDVTPFFLKAGTKTGLKIRYKNPTEVGADRIANAIAVTRRYPAKNVIVADFGTATTFDVVSADKEYLGGAIMPGMKIAMTSLEQKTARLPKVEIVKPKRACGRTTVESIQSGLYFGTLGMIRILREEISRESFGGEKPLFIGTGGFARLFAESGEFDDIQSDLVLEGIYHAMEMNK